MSLAGVPTAAPGRGGAQGADGAVAAADSASVPAHEQELMYLITNYLLHAHGGVANAAGRVLSQIAVRVWVCGCVCGGCARGGAR